MGCDENVISMNSDSNELGAELNKLVEVGQTILVDEGALKLQVTEVSEDFDHVVVQVCNDYKLTG